MLNSFACGCADEPRGAGRRQVRQGLDGMLSKTIIRVAWLVLGLWLGAAVGLAQNTPREVRALAQQALMKGEFEAAAGYLTQLVEWYKDSDGEQTIAGMELVYFNLGLCYYLTGQFGTAEGRFGDYLKRYPKGFKASEASVYIGDAQRYSNDLKKAAETYEQTIRKYELDDDWLSDVLCSLARCALADGDWKRALPYLERARVVAPDFRRANWASTLLVTAYLKEFELEKVFDLIPILMQPGSFASRSIAFNMAALEAADLLFADERYREALWLYRLVYSREVIDNRSKRHLEMLKFEAEEFREASGMYRELLRAQEAIAEAEAELEALQQVENYDSELFFRMARSYMETRRYREARTLFVYLHGTVDGEAAEEALYLAFTCALQVQPWEKAFGLGHDYLRKYPGGVYYDGVSLSVGQMYATLKDWPQVIAVLTEAVTISPRHESMAECMFMIGYAHFMEEDFPQCISWLQRLNENYPGNDRQEEASYWLAMGLLFDKRYELAFTAFSAFLAGHPESIYVEDATFRRAVAVYGQSQYREAEELLAGFVASFPDSLLVGEALMMLGDVAGFFGELERAVERFQQAVDYELNIELYNYCCFRAGEILAELQKYPELVAHFRAYIERDREESNLPQAIYWVVKGLWQQDERQGALAYFMDCIKEYGADRSALGIDLLLEEWVGLSRQLTPEAATDAWRSLTRTMNEAAHAGQRTLELRLKRLMLFQPGVDDTARRILLDELVRPENLPVASPSVIELIMDEAAKRQDVELSLLAASTMVADFPETDYGIAARMRLAEVAIERQEYETAQAHLHVVREVFATNIEAAQALYLLAQIAMERRQFDEADKWYTEILGVREWRGPLWPAAIFGRGEAARLRSRHEQAAAFYERIYLLYGNYTEWVAKAYVQRAGCLLRLRKNREAKEVLEAMLANADLAARPEAAEAREMLAKLQGGQL